VIAQQSMPDRKPMPEAFLTTVDEVGHGADVAMGDFAERIAPR
jgi:hypothetical protein